MVRKGVSSTRPELWFLGSLLVRMSIVLAGLWWVAGGHVGRLLLCLLGVIMARPIVRWLMMPEDILTRPPRGESHAPQS